MIYKSIPSISIKDSSPISTNSPKPDSRRRRSNKTESFDMTNSNHISNPILILPIKNDNKDEKFIIARSYIKRLKNSEYFFI